MNVPVIVQEVVLPISCAEAFVLFTTRLGDWWIREYSWSGENLDTLWIEAFAGGRCVERDRSGEETVWGTVIDCNPGHRLAFRWQINPDRSQEPDPDRASLVVADWKELENGGCLMCLEHGGFERHPVGNPKEYRDGLASEYGWPLLLEKYAEAAHR